MSLLLAVGSGLSIASIGYYDSQLTRIETGKGAGPDGLVHVDANTPACLRRVCNYLILGSDARGEIEGKRADTIIVVHTNPKAEGAVVLSIPRDLLVEIPGHGQGKMAMAFSYDRDTMVQAVERLTKLDVNHYVQVNFAGFRAIVDALGGVEVCVARPMRDVNAHLNIPRKGCHNLNGRQALAFVRARSVEGDRIPDFARIARQQQFLRVLLHKLLSPGQVFRLPRLMRAVRGNLEVDKELNIYELQDLTKELGDATERKVSFRVVPAVPVLIDGVSYVEAVQPAADRLFERIRKGKPLGRLGKTQISTPMSPATISIRVLDAGSRGKAQAVHAYLTKAGFNTFEVAPVTGTVPRNRVLYPRRAKEQAKVVAAYLPGIGRHPDETNTAGADITIVVGAGFRGVPES